MKILDSFLKKIGTDKALHFFGGGFGCSLVSFIVILQEPTLTWWQKIAAVTIGAVFVFILSILKEIFWDERPDWIDVAAAMLGCLLVYMFVGIGVLFNFLSM